MEINKIKITKVKSNPDNPRVIKDTKYKALVESIKEFPEMLSLRPIVVDEDMIVLGGNMRYRACRELGMKEIPVLIYTREHHLTTDAHKKFNKSYEDVRDEFIIKDNVSFGEWDWDVLGNVWNETKLKVWGMDVWQPEEDVSNNVDYSLNTAEEKLNRFLDAKIKNITIPFENEEFDSIVDRLEVLLLKYKCEDYRTLIYKILENEKV